VSDQVCSSHSFKLSNEYGEVKSLYLPLYMPVVWRLPVKHSFKPVRGNDVYHGSEYVMITIGHQDQNVTSSLCYKIRADKLVSQGFVLKAWINDNFQEGCAAVLRKLIGFCSKALSLTESTGRILTSCLTLIDWLVTMLQNTPAATQCRVTGTGLRIYVR
jgi:hypothetical protein